MSTGATEKSCLSRIVSGGQTGVDQGALAAALAAGVPCGGWCPVGRKSEQGVIPSRYPVQELRGAGYRERTLQNVVESDGTAIIFLAVLEGGTRLTARYCEQKDRPYVLIDAAAHSHADAVTALQDFLLSNDIEVLNVAGPRESKWPEAYSYTLELLTDLFAGLRSA